MFYDNYKGHFIIRLVNNSIYNCICNCCVLFMNYEVRVIPYDVNVLLNVFNFHSMNEKLTNAIIWIMNTLNSIQFNSI